MTGPEGQYFFLANLTVFMQIAMLLSCFLLRILTYGMHCISRETTIYGLYMNDYITAYDVIMANIVTHFISLFA